MGLSPVFSFSCGLLMGGRGSASSEQQACSEGSAIKAEPSFSAACRACVHGTATKVEPSITQHRMTRCSMPQHSMHAVSAIAGAISAASQATQAIQPRSAARRNPDHSVPQRSTACSSCAAGRRTRRQSQQPSNAGPIHTHCSAALGDDNMPQGRLCSMISSILPCAAGRRTRPRSRPPAAQSCGRGRTRGPKSRPAEEVGGRAGEAARG